MTDKMTIEKAKEIIATWSDCDCCDFSKAKGFIECYESRNVEVEELKKELKMVMDYAHHSNFCNQEHNGINGNCECGYYLLMEESK